MTNTQTPPGLLFLGTDTGVGKTYQATRFAGELRERQVAVGVYKPVATGLVSDFRSISDTSGEIAPSDALLLCDAAGHKVSMLSRICPQAFSAPLAPPAAAALEGRVVNEAQLLEGAYWWRDRCQFLVVEGAGGVMSPISERMTCLDLAEGLQFPIVLVTANRLGCISHILLACEAIRSRGLRLMAIVLNTPTVPDGTAIGSGTVSGVLGSTEASTPFPPSSALGCQESDYLQETRESNRWLIGKFLPDIPLIEDARLIADFAEILILIRSSPKLSNH